MWLDELELEEENLKINGLDLIEAIFASFYQKGITTIQMDVLQKVMETKKDNSKLSPLPLDVLPELGIEFFKNHIFYDDYKYNLKYENEEVENILSKISDEVKEEIEDIIAQYNKNRLLSLDEFVPFLLAALKENTKLEKTLTEEEKKYAYLPTDYLNTIVHILTNGNKWNEIFNNLIRIERENDMLQIDYFEFCILDKMRSFSSDRHVTYCFYSESIMIEMSEEEKEEILSKYDEDTIHQMRWFADLVVDLPQVHAIQRNMDLNKSEDIYPQRKLVKKYEPKRLKK